MGKVFHMSQKCFCAGFRRPFGGYEGNACICNMAMEAICLTVTGAETFSDMYFFFFFQHRRSNSSEMWPRLPGGVDGEGRGPQQQWQK